MGCACANVGDRRRARRPAAHRRVRQGREETTTRRLHLLHQRGKGTQSRGGDGLDRTPGCRKLVLTMSYSLAIIEQPGYLHFTVTGQNSRAAVRGYLGEIRAACAARQCRTILIEENLSGPGLAVGEIFQLASAGSEAT